MLYLLETANVNVISIQTDVNVISTGNRYPCDVIYSDVSVIFTRDRYQCYLPY